MGDTERSRAGDDPFLWLEDVDGDRALSWVRAQNARTLATLGGDPRFAALEDDARSVLDSAGRLPGLRQRDGWLYQLHRGPAQPRGLYRRTTPDRLAADDWDPVLDVDALSAREGRAWVLAAMIWLPGTDRALAKLSDGGGDAAEVREFDLARTSFVEGGFALPPAKHDVAWRDADHLYLGTDSGPGSLTSSGYPRICRLWRRGTPPQAAEPLFAGDPECVHVRGYRMRSAGGDLDLVSEAADFWTSRHHQIVGGRLHPLPLPLTAVIEDLWDGRLVVLLQNDWAHAGRSYRRGSLLLVDADGLRNGDGQVVQLFDGADTPVVRQVEATADGVLVSLLEQVSGRLRWLRPGPDGVAVTEVAVPALASVGIDSADEVRNEVIVRFESFLEPPRLLLLQGPGVPPRELCRAAATFDAAPYAVTQRFATSADGTEVPYFLVAPREGSGPRPAHLFSYGGFRNALTPSYSGTYEANHGAYGRLWLDRGGVFALANIRGGGELGPDWHAAALGTARHRAFEDFEAVAEHLVATGVTTAGRIGIEGRSNGGLLVGAAMTRAPGRYGAVVCGVPLLDMRRYHRLLAGASWVAEYGDPDDPEMWSYLAGYSPYHTVRAGETYPPILFFTSTRDDRVHPGHARKMAARMIDQGHEVFYWENVEGGHGGSSTNAQLATRLALSYAHLWRCLG